jgi:hypothetical protein
VGEGDGWEQCLRAAERSLSITVRDYNYLSQAWAWGPEPYDLAAIASHHLGKKDKAIEYVGPNTHNAIVDFIKEYS